MTPQELNDEALRRAKEEQDKLTEATLAGADATDKAKAANLKMETATSMAVQQLQKLLDVQLRYTIAMAKGVKGSAAFNDSVDATADVMTTAVNAIGTALAFLLPGGVLIKGLVGGLTFLTTNAIKSAAALQKAANEQGDALDKAYKSMSKSGATASDGMTGLFKDVNRMRLNVMQLDAMAQTMANNAKEMTAMGGTVYKARKEYADLTENMKGFEKGMLMLGMSHEDQAEAIMGFMKMQSNLSQGQQKDYGQLKGAARKYIEETEALTRVTGMNRKEQEAAQEKYMAQQRFGAKVQQLMDEGKVDEANLLQSQMKKYAAKGDQFAQAFADMTTGMITSDAAMKGNMSTQGKMLEEANAITEGRIKTETEANESFQETMVAVKGTTKSFNALYQAGVGEDFLLPFKEGADITKAANQNFAVQIKEAETEVKKLTGTIGKADEQLNRRVDMEIKQNDRMIATQKDLDNKFQDTAVGTGTFMEKLAKAFDPLIKMIGKSLAVFEPLASGLGDMLIGAISGVVKIMTGDVIGGLKEFKAGWDSAAKGLEDTVGKWWDNFTDIWSTFGKNLLKSVEFVTGPLGPVFEKMGTMATDVWDSIKKSADDFGAGLLKGIALITSPLTDAFDKVKTGVLGLTDGLKEGMGKFSDKLVEMVNDIWKKLVNLIPGLGKAKEFAGAAVDTTKQYAQKGADTVKDAGGAVSDWFSKTYEQGFGGKKSAAPAGGKIPGGGQITDPNAADYNATYAEHMREFGGAPAPAAASGKSAPAPAGGKAPAPAPAPAPAGGKAPAPSDGNGQAPKPSGDVPKVPPQKTKGGGTMGEDEIKAMISQHEGFVPYPYKDSKGLWTIGVGHLIGNGSALPEEYAAYANNGRPGAKGNNTTPAGSTEYFNKLFDEDYAKHRKQAATVPMFGAMSQTMQGAFTDLAFNMGGAWWQDWPILQQQLKNKDAGAVAKNLRGAKWASDVGPNRTANVTGLVETGFQAAKGGVFDGPKSGYAATLHGNEAVIPLKDGAVPVSMSQEFNMTATNLGELVNQMKYNMAVQDRMITVLEEIRRAQTTTADNTGRMVAYASN